MVWQIRIDEAARKDLAKLDKQVAKRILGYLRDRVANLDNPRRTGSPLKGSKLGEFWKYRVGNYRIISKIQDATLHVLVVRIRHRREVYR